MNRNILVLMAIGSLLMCRVSFAQSTSRQAWENRPLGVRDTGGASEWWINTWRTGDQLRMEAKYQVEGKLRITDRSAVKWYDLNRFKKFLEIDNQVDIQGVCKSTTTVLWGSDILESGKTQLIRTYECPISMRGNAVVGLKGGLEAEKAIQNAYVSFYNELGSDGIANMIEERCTDVLAWVAGKVSDYFLPGSGENAKFALRPFVRRISKPIVAFASKKMEQYYENCLQRLAGSKFDDGGIEMKLNSIFYKKIDSAAVNDTLAFATQFNSLFAGKAYYIASGVGDTPFGRLIDTGNEAEKCLNETTDYRRLPRRMENLPESDDEFKASAVFTREALNVNAKLFDMRQRKPGESWKTDASILNNFLHPDLKGRFSGIIIMRYNEDREITLNTAGPAEKQRYQVRYLEMVTDEQGERTNFQYSEGTDFNFKYDPEERDTEATISIFVDAESGYIVQVKAEMKGTIDMLPDLKLTRGWGFSNGEGEIKFKMSAEAVPTKILQKNK